MSSSITSWEEEEEEELGRGECLGSGADAAEAAVTEYAADAAEAAVAEYAADTAEAAVAVPRPLPPPPSSSQIGKGERESRSAVKMMSRCDMGESER